MQLSGNGPEQSMAVQCQSTAYRIISVTPYGIHGFPHSVCGSAISATVHKPTVPVGSRHAGQGRLDDQQ
jgi:hypothetical protein